MSIGRDRSTLDHAKRTPRLAVWGLALLALIVGIVLLRIGLASTGTTDSAMRDAPVPSDGASLTNGRSAQPGTSIQRSSEDTGTAGGRRSTDTTPEDPADEPMAGGSTSEGMSGLPLVMRVYAAAKQGRWREAVGWLDDELAKLPPGPVRNLQATLRVHLLMEYGPRVDGALALASLLSDASLAMAKGRFSVAESPDAYHQPQRCALFAGLFVVAAPETGWPVGGSTFEGFMVGHAQDLGRRHAPHLRSHDAYLASLAPFVESALTEVPKDDAGTREVLDATRAYIELNERIRREGGERVRTRTTAPLEEAVASFIRVHSACQDARVASFVQFLFRAFPDWAQKALDPAPRDG
jgi:hypothetical protein